MISMPFMRFFLFRVFPIILLVVCNNPGTLSAQLPGVKKKQGRTLQMDSMRQKLQKLADSIYQLNGGKPVLPPESAPVSEQAPVREAEPVTAQSPKRNPYIWIGGAAVLLVPLLFIFTRRKKG
jgi:hypothetical protein